MKWIQRPDMIITVDWDAKPQIKNYKDLVFKSKGTISLE